MDKIKRAHSQHFVITENWFDGDVMVVNTKKIHYRYFGKDCKNNDFVFNEIKLSNSCGEKLLAAVL